jgi:Fe-Mn family superoxide dismutase
MTVELPPLPFDPAALEPHMSRKTLEFHHGKHHKAYVETTNKLIAGTDLEKADLATIVRTAHKKGDKKLFNASAQAWNHTFFWNCLSPSGGEIDGAIADRLKQDLGDIAKFKEAFKKEATEHFASGWAWLVVKDGKLAVTSYHDADTPLVHEGVTPLLTCDVWEHAYYLDYQNERPKFIDTFLNHLANWRFAEKNLT